MIDGCEIVQATTEDIDGILDLRERNQPERGGTLSAWLPRAWLEAAVADMPVIVAKKEGLVVGYLISASRAASAGVPIVLLNRAAPQSAFSTVSSDNAAGGALVAEYLLRLGDKRTALKFLRGNLGGAPSAKALARVALRLAAPYSLFEWRKLRTQARASRRYGRLPGYEREN